MYLQEQKILTVSNHFSFCHRGNIRRPDRRERSRAFERPALGSNQSYFTAAAVLWIVEVPAEPQAEAAAPFYSESQVSDEV